MLFRITVVLLCVLCFACQSHAPKETSHAWAMVIHGGAGFSKKGSLSKEKEAEYHTILNQALTRGELILKNGGTSEDAVVEVIAMLEDSPLFNAGKGAVFTHDKQNELDASIMKGDDMNAGAVAGVRSIKNPIKAARAVMNDSKHVLLTARGAETFASSQSLEQVDSSYFFTQKNYDRLLKILDEEKDVGLDDEQQSDEKFGTVGAVALDQSGNITAGTSTGGMTNKKWDRVGDSPIIGAGTYANNATCGVSCTGHGEYFIRYAVATDVSKRMEYLGEGVGEAAEHIIHSSLKAAGGNGGLIALDKYGNITMPFNTTAMFRGFVRPDTLVTLLYE